MGYTGRMRRWRRICDARAERAQGGHPAHAFGSGATWRTRLRKPRVALALTAAIVCFGVFSSAVGTGALPTASLPAFGVTNGDGSLSTVAELGDINGDGFGDYAVGLPSADVGGSADAGIVYVFLGHARRAAGDAHGDQPRERRRSGSSATRGEMLGYTIVGNDVNGDGLADIAIGAPMAGPPSKVGGGAVYVVFGRAEPGRRQHDDALVRRPTRTPR